MVHLCEAAPQGGREELAQPLGPRGRPTFRGPPRRSEAPAGPAHNSLSRLEMIRLRVVGSAEASIHFRGGSCHPLDCRPSHGENKTPSSPPTFISQTFQKFSRWHPIIPTDPMTGRAAAARTLLTRGQSLQIIPDILHSSPAMAGDGCLLLFLKSSLARGAPAGRPRTGGGGARLRCRGRRTTPRGRTGWREARPIAELLTCLCVCV